MDRSFGGVGFAELVSRMTVEEKVDLLSGQRMWKTHAIERLGIPEIVMTDGTYGVRYSIDQIDGNEAGGQDFAAFLSVVGRKANDIQAAWGHHKAATCFPNGSAFGCSWDVDLAQRLGAALAEECQALGVHLLLGPGINIRRTPLGGRSYEYYAEDPVLTGDIAAAVIDGVQEGGVGTSLKHFACNNSEVERTTMDSVVDERALREVYLASFERAIGRGRPWTVMSSYNRLNGTQAAENPWLLTEVLRDEWGYDGLVISDWHGIKDRPASLIAGNDLDMPESETRKHRLADAIRAGAVPSDVVDRACERVLALVRQAKDGERRGGDQALDAHHRLARRIAAESIVLLKNADGLLPLDPTRHKHIAVIGQGAVEPVFQGSGCATTSPSRVDVPLAEIEAAVAGRARVAFHRGYDDEDPAAAAALRHEAVAAAAGADVTIVFVHTEVGYDGEGSDRRHLGLAPGHDALVEALAAATPRLVVVLANPDAVVMPWLDEVEAVVETFFAGQAMGGAVADIVFGAVNPSGKLSVTFPKRIQDIPGTLTYPGENGRHLYAEGIHVGYRHYDKRAVEPLFPFGFGLSYTTFAYAGLRVDTTDLGPDEGLRLRFRVTNTGTVRGKEIAQVYLQPAHPRLARPLRELKAFVKIELDPREAKTVEVALDARSFQYYDPAAGGWVLDDDRVTIAVGASSRDIRLTAEVDTHAAAPRHRRMTADIQPVFVLDNPIARRHLIQFLRRKLGIGGPDAERMLEHCRNSFVGIFTTLDRRLRVRSEPAEIEALVDAVNEEMEADQCSTTETPARRAARPISA